MWESSVVLDIAKNAYPTDGLSDEIIKGVEAKLKEDLLRVAAEELPKDDSNTYLVRFYSKVRPKDALSYYEEDANLDRITVRMSIQQLLDSEDARIKERIEERFNGKRKV